MAEIFIDKRFLFVLFLMIGVTPGSAQEAEGFFRITPGVLADLSTDRIYFSTGGSLSQLYAVDGKSGDTIWERRFGELKPLSIVGDRLIAQYHNHDRLENVTLDNVLRIAIFDLHSGDVLTTASVVLDQDVQVSIGATDSSQFLIDTQSEDASGTILVWRYQEMEHGGRAEDQTEGREYFGALDVDPESGEISLVADLGSPASEGGPPYSRNPWKEPVRFGLTEDQIESGLIYGEGITVARPSGSETQEIEGEAGGESGEFLEGDVFALSADEQYVLGSTFEGPNENWSSSLDAWNEYSWYLYNRATGARTEKVPSHVSVQPFVVIDQDIVVYEAHEYSREVLVDTENDNQVLEFFGEPFSIVAKDMNTGDEIWRAAVRDTTDRRNTRPAN